MDNILRAKDTGAPGNGGHFAGRTRTSDTASLSPAILHSAGGYAIEVTPGVLDDAATVALTEGQCVALAVAVAERLGADKISVLTETEGNETRIVHAWVEAPDDDEQMIDGDGRGDVDEFLDDWYLNRSEPCFECDECDDGESEYCTEKSAGDEGMDVIELTVDETRQMGNSGLGAGLPVQDWDLVATFVDPVLEKADLA